MNSRLVLILALCLVLAAVALGLVKRKANQMAAAKQSPASLVGQGPRAAAQGAGVGKAAEADPNAPRPIGYGLTYALIPERNPDMASLGCSGEPAQLDRPHNGACNPHQGDTSCRTVLPVLCFRPGNAPAPQQVHGPAGSSSAPQASAWTGGSLGAAPALMGAILESEAYANAYCEKELGAGWRMAEYHDGGGRGGMVQGQRSLGLSQNTRHWVLSRNQPANCWNSKP